MTVDFHRSRVTYYVELLDMSLERYILYINYDGERKAQHARNSYGKGMYVGAYPL